MRQSRYNAAALLVLLLAACAPKSQPTPAPPPPAPAPAAAAPKQNLVVLLPDPNGKHTSITVTNSAGSQTISQPNQSVQIQAENVAPTAPAPLDQQEVQRLFGSAVSVLPAAEVSFSLYFDQNRDVLTAASEAQIPALLAAIRDRHSTTISVIGHTDTTANPQFNYQLGQRRAQTVAKILRERGVDASAMSVESHGDADLAVPTGRNVAEPLNRRVEVIVR